MLWPESAINSLGIEWPTPQTQTRAVVWLNGVPHDLGTLGGTAPQAFFVNESGEIAGESYLADSVAPPNLHSGDELPVGKASLTFETVGGTQMSSGALWYST